MVKAYFTFREAQTEPMAAFEDLLSKARDFEAKVPEDLGSHIAEFRALVTVPWE